MRSQLEMQKDPLWGAIHSKLTQQERDLLVEVMTDIRREAFEDCAKIAESYSIVVHPHWDVEGNCPHRKKSRDGRNIAELIRGTS